jgi:hypothetical protein
MMMTTLMKLNRMLSTAKITHRNLPFNKIKKTANRPKNQVDVIYLEKIKQLNENK